MANPWHPDNSPNTPKGTGQGGDRTGAVEADVEERRGKQGDEVADLPPTEVWIKLRKSTRPQGAGKRQKLRRRERKRIGTGME